MHHVCPSETLSTLAFCCLSEWHPLHDLLMTMLAGQYNCPADMASNLTLAGTALQCFQHFCHHHITELITSLSTKGPQHRTKSYQSRKILVSSHVLYSDVPMSCLSVPGRTVFYAVSSRLLRLDRLTTAGSRLPWQWASCLLWDCQPRHGRGWGACTMQQVEDVRKG